MESIYIHPSSIVETQSIGLGTRIWAFTHVMEGAYIGANCNIGEHCFIESGAVIGDNVTIKNGNMIWEGVTLEDGVFVGPNASFTNDLYPRSPRLPQAKNRYNNHQWLSPTLVKQGSTLGAGAVVLPGVIVGEFSMIGAGSVVTRDVPAYAMVAGNPGRVRGWFCQCGQPLTFQGANATCNYCGLAYINEGNIVRPTGGVENSSHRSDSGGLND